MTTRPRRPGDSPQPANGRTPRRRPSPWLWDVVESRLLMAALNEVSVQTFTVTKPTTGSTPEAFTVNVGTPTGESVLTVDYAVTPVNAVPGVDYQLGFPATGQLTFGLDGPFTATLPLTVQGGTQDGGPHEVRLTLSHPTGGASISPTAGSGVGVINDNAQPGVLQFSAPDYPVSTLGGTVLVTVTRTGGTASGVSVHYATGGGTADPTLDYVPTSGTLTFGYGVTSLSFPVTITPNFLLGGPRTIGLTLSDPVTAGLTQSPPGMGATLGPQSTASVVTIQPVNALIVTNTADEGFGSLRQAIRTANGLPGVNTITFHIPGPSPHVITPGSPLPALTKPAVVDARTEPGYRGVPVVTLDGSRAGAVANGLEVLGGSTGVYGLAVDGFGGSGVVLASGHNTVQADRIGTDPSGSSARGNGYDGVYVYGGPNNPGGASGNVIGGPRAADRNVISGNGNVGVDLTGPNASMNAIQGNLIGTDATGTRALPNGRAGVFLNGAATNLVGGDGARRNVIAGNGGSGVVAFGPGATANVVQNNRIGTDVAGRASLGNTGDGIFLDDAPGNTIAGNVISANGLTGVRTMGQGASGNRVLGNFIGTDATGSAGLGNTYDGVFLNGSPNNLVGNGSPAGRNLISANGSSGLQIFGATASGNRVLGNRIGTDAAGNAALPNRRDGVFVNAAPGNAIGGTAAAAGNLVSGNLQVGVQVFGPASTGNVVLNNEIGTNLRGDPVVGNGFGLFLNDAPNNTVGGVNATGSNRIAGNRSGNIVKPQKQGGDAVLVSTAPVVTGATITGVVLTFSQPLDPVTAQDLSNYSFRVQPPGGPVGPRVGLGSAVYDPGALMVSLSLAEPVAVSGTHRVTIKA
ncbi:MAG: hypothetical protein LC745_07125, partial [Planctomycetia bacterium]|nr:hypothetical protein [Planctomycetia bacterium]